MVEYDVNTLIRDEAQMLIEFDDSIDEIESDEEYDALVDAKAKEIKEELMKTASIEMNMAYRYFYIAKGGKFMSKWWKSPVLQGPENDYGDYDYLIEDIPRDSVTWSKWERTCGECGKKHMWNLCHTHYFRTMDGWDSIDHYECWVCYLKRKIAAPFKKVAQKLQKFIYVRKRLYHTCRLYKKSTGKRLSKDYKDTLKSIYGRGV